VAAPKEKPGNFVVVVHLSRENLVAPIHIFVGHLPKEAVERRLWLPPLALMHHHQQDLFFATLG
jgi:hypothetical protein